MHELHWHRQSDPADMICKGQHLRLLQDATKATSGSRSVFESVHGLYTPHVLLPSCV